MEDKLKDALKRKSVSYREQIGEPAYLERERAFLKDNYMVYVKKPLMIGFSHSFPEHSDKTKVIDEMTITTDSGTFNVRYGPITFGDDEKYTVSGITTDRYEIPRKGPMGGWGSHGYADEAEAMELAVVKMAAKHNLMICDKRCSWPHAKAIVQKVYDAHIRCYDLNNQK